MTTGLGEGIAVGWHVGVGHSRCGWQLAGVLVPRGGSVGAPVRACPAMERVTVRQGEASRLPGLPVPWPVSQGRCLRFLGRIEGCRVAMETE